MSPYNIVFKGFLLLMEYSILPRGHFDLPICAQGKVKNITATVKQFIIGARIDINVFLVTP